MGRRIIRCLRVHHHAVYPGMSLADRPAKPPARANRLKMWPHPALSALLLAAAGRKMGVARHGIFAVRFAQMSARLRCAKNFSLLGKLQNPTAWPGSIGDLWVCPGQTVALTQSSRGASESLSLPGKLRTPMPPLVSSAAGLVIPKAAPSICECRTRYEMAGADTSKKIEFTR